jgi:arginine repressor
VRKPRYLALGRSRKLANEDEDAILEYLVQDGCRQQEDIVAWLLAQGGVVVSRPTGSRVLKRRGWMEKRALRIKEARAKGNQG